LISVGAPDLVCGSHSTAPGSYFSGEEEESKGMKGKWEGTVLSK